MIGSFCRGNRFVFLCLNVFVLFWALPALAASQCNLAKHGDCCTVTLAPGSNAAIKTGIVSSNLVDFLVIETVAPSTCEFDFNGEIAVPMRARPGEFIGSWIGGNSTLSYKGSDPDQGSCQLAVFYMSTSDTSSEAGMPTSCGKNAP